MKDKIKGHPGNNCVLEGKDHAGGKRSWWWERIMLVAKDHAGGGRSLILQKYDFCTKKYCFCTEQTPVCPFATKITAKYMSARARPDPTHYFTQQKFPCRDRPAI